MKRIFQLILFNFITFSITFAGEPRLHYFNGNVGVGNFKSPLIYNYSVNYTIDLNISKRSAITLGLEWDNFYQHTEFSVDTNFIYFGNTSGGPIPQYYFINQKVMDLNPSVGFKYCLKKSKAKALYLEAKINFIYEIRDITKYEYYYRDTNQTLHLGPYPWTIDDTKKRYGWLPDNVRPALAFGYLKNINEHFAWHFKFDLVVTVPDQHPRDLSLFYPKLGVGLAFY